MRNLADGEVERSSREPELVGATDHRRRHLRLSSRTERGVSRAASERTARPDASHGDAPIRTRAWPEARVAFERVADVADRCPRCDALLTRQLGPGVLCSCCGRLWLVREMLAHEIGWG